MRVRYTPTGETGTFKRYNSSGEMVFVQFDGDPQPKACYPEDLAVIGGNE